jgi:hypothetical protein
MAKQRFTTETAYKALDQTETVPAKQFAAIINDKSSVYMCSPKFIEDTEWVECPSNLREFVNSAVDRLSNFDAMRFRSTFSHTDFSLFCVQNLNLSNDDTVAAFFSTTAQERIDI